MKVQTYKSSVGIPDVKLLNRPIFNDDGGSFSEVVRVNPEGFVEGLDCDFKIAQVSFSRVDPGSIKAYHVHTKQADLWYVPPTSRLLVNLVDLRIFQDSEDWSRPLKPQQARYILGDGKASLLYIPQGVAHGCCNLNNSPMTLFYFTSTQFNVEDPDEYRLPWNFFDGTEWEMTRG